MSNRCNDNATTVNARSIGIDVHLNKLVACFLAVDTEESGAEVQRREFLTTAADSEGTKQMSEWVASKNPDAVIFESTGIYWIPLFRTLEDMGLNPEVINPRIFYRREEGRKTDTSDAAWLAQMARLGMYRGSFIPGEPFRSLRLLLAAHRKTLNEYRNEKNRLLKYLDSCGIHLSVVFSDPHGVSAREVLQLVLDGELTEEKISEVVDSRCKASPAEILKSVSGKLTDMARYLVNRSLKGLAQKEEAILEDIEHLSRELKPYEAYVDLLKTIPGISESSAKDIVAIIGTDIEKNFSSSAKFSRWAGCCPGNNESAGKRKKERMPHGLKAFKTTIIECAQGAARTKGTQFFEKFQKKRHKGYKAAVGAVAHMLVKVIYHVLTQGTLYVDTSKEHRKFKQLSKANKSRWIAESIDYAKKYPERLNEQIREEIRELSEMFRTEGKEALTMHQISAPL